MLRLKFIIRRSISFNQRNLVFINGWVEKFYVRWFFIGLALYQNLKLIDLADVRQNTRHLPLDGLLTFDLIFSAVDVARMNHFSYSIF